MLMAQVECYLAGSKIEVMNTYNFDSTGKRIRWAREQVMVTDADGRQHRMTQQELSRKIGVRNVSLSYIENDHRNMSLDLLQKIASVTGVTVGFLLKETPYPYRVAELPEPEPVYFSEEADNAARLIDDVSPPKRAEILSVLRTMAAYALEQERGEQTDYPNNPLEEQSKGGINSFAQRLIHGDKVRQSEAQREAGV